jgi:hypothetical protein
MAEHIEDLQQRFADLKNASSSCEAIFDADSARKQLATPWK